MFEFLKNLFKRPDYKALIEEQGALIIDVRNPHEYKAGHIKNSQNIPLDNIASKTDHISKKGKPIVTVCASGRRSGIAAKILKNAGIEAYNGGGWSSLKSRLG